MKRIGSLTLAALTLIAVWYAGPMCRGTEKAYAQVELTGYQLTYFDVATAFAPSAGGYGGAGNSGGSGDALLRMVNDGAQVTDPGTGDICANIYVYNDVQEQQECCSCPLTANSLLTASVINNLTSNPFNRSESLSAGVIKIVSTTGACSNSCTATTAAFPVGAIAQGLHAWLNHTEKMASNQASFSPSYGFITSTSVARLEPAALSAGELTNELEAGCAAINGANLHASECVGICSCGEGD